MKKQKFLAVLLTLALLVCALPMAALAAPDVGGSDTAGGGDGEAPELSTTNVGSEDELRKALAGDSSDIGLTGDITLTSPLEITRSVEITGNGTEGNFKISGKIIFIHGDGITVDFEDVDFSREGEGNGFLIVGRNQAQDETTEPTVNFTNCTIHFTPAADKETSSMGAINLAGGSAELTGCKVTSTRYVIVVNGLDANNNANGKTRRLTLKGTTVEGTANDTKAIITNSGTKSGDTISVTGGSVSGWNALTLMGSGVQATLTDVKVNCTNTFTSGVNNYAAIVFGAETSDQITDNAVTVTGGSITCKGADSSNGQEYIAAFYNQDNTLNVNGTALSVSGNPSGAFFLYTREYDPGNEAYQYKPGAGKMPVTVENVTFNGYRIDQPGGRFENIYSDLEKALNMAEEGSTVTLGQDAPGDAQIDLDKNIIIDPNGYAQPAVTPAKNSVLVYSNTGDTLEQVKLSDLKGKISLAAVGFKADKAEANAALNTALKQAQGFEANVADCDPNTVYVVLSNKVKGDLAVKMTLDGAEYYSEPLPADGGRAIYFTFTQGAGAPTSQPIKAGEYTVTLTAGADAILTGQLPIYEMRFDVDGTVTGGTYALAADAANAPKPGDPAKAGYRFTGWSAAAQDDASHTITYTALWEKASSPQQPSSQQSSGQGGAVPAPVLDSTPMTGETGFAALALAGLAFAGLGLIARRKER